MADPLDETQEAPIVKDSSPPIPTYEQHEGSVRKLWFFCITLSTILFLGTTSVLVALWMDNYDLAKILGVSSLAFQVIVVSYGAGFFVPAFMTSLKRLGLSVRMMYQSIDLGNQAADSMKELRNDVAPLVKRGNLVMDKVEPVVEKLRGVLLDDNALEGFLSDIRIIRERVQRDTEPLPAPRRPKPMVGSAAAEKNNGEPDAVPNS